MMRVSAFTNEVPLLLQTSSQSRRALPDELSPPWDPRSMDANLARLKSNDWHRSRESGESKQIKDSSLWSIFVTDCFGD